MDFGVEEFRCERFSALESEGILGSTNWQSRAVGLEDFHVQHLRTWDCC